MRVKSEKEESLKKQRMLEKEYFMQINYQYHVERKSKIEEMKQTEDHIIKLEEEEERMLKQLN